jgi:hypothetical protein
METYEWVSNGINIYLMDFDICMYIITLVSIMPPLIMQFWHNHICDQPLKWWHIFTSSHNLSMSKTKQNKNLLKAIKKFHNHKAWSTIDIINVQTHSSFILNHEYKIAYKIS